MSVLRSAAAALADIVFVLLAPIIDYVATNHRYNRARQSRNVRMSRPV